MFCKNCGQELVDGMEKCPFCNTPTSDRMKNRTYSVQQNNNTSGSGCSVILSLIIPIALLFGAVKFFLQEFDNVEFDTNTIISEVKDTFSSDYSEKKDAFSSDYSEKKDTFSSDYSDKKDTFSVDSDIDDISSISNDFDDSFSSIFDSSPSENDSSNNSNIQTHTETYNINARKDASLFMKGNITLTILNYQTESYNSVVGKVEDGQEWVIYNIKFENNSNSTVIINKNDFEIVDGAGRYGYRPYPKHLDTELDIMEIRAGQSATFSVRFVYYKNYEMSLRYYNADLETNSYDEYIEIKVR